MVELIKKKRDGQEHSLEDIQTIINGFVHDDIPDYQVAAWLMAVYFKGLNDQETAMLTDTMMRSGELIDLSSIKGIKVDKHSTGGVGDKTTLVLAPLVAAAGVPVAKMSGRGLGHTGGTLDKLESIPGFQVDMTANQFIENVKKHDIAICSQNASLVPADKKLYALRDVTGTVDNISLIASSVMSKKLACGADAIVIDLKVGDGAFIKTLADAEKLAEIMIGTAQRMNKRLTTVITGMEEPLGYAIGNTLEVKEAIDTLRGHGPEDLTELCLVLGSHMLVLADKAATESEARSILQTLIANGKAFDKLVEVVESQQGESDYILHPDRFVTASLSHPHISQQAGYITQLSAMDIGLAAVCLGAGRETKESLIDYSAGIVLSKKVGDHVQVGDQLATLYANDGSLFNQATKYLDLAYTFSETKPVKQQLILKSVS
ncbi:MAG: pyrimidine-nucleoside phosphorylase [Saprospiraceae bacterium]